MNRKIRVSFTDLAGKSLKFEGFRELADFLESEARFWKEKYELLNKTKNNVHPALSFHTNFIQADSTIKGWSAQLEDWDEAQLHQQINSLISQFFRHINSHWLWSGHPFVATFIESHDQHGHEVATAFLDYVAKKHISNINTSNGFLGVMIGYEFINQDSDLLKRRNSEKVSLGHLRTRLEETTTKLTGEVENFKTDISSWDSKTRDDWSTFLENASIDDSSQKGLRSEEFSRYITECKNNITSLENTYKEKLRLEMPAQYWKSAARKFGIQGGLWFLALTASVLLGIYYFSEFFNNWLQGQKLAVQLNSIQGIVIFGTILTTYAFFVRTISRVTFSSLHLMRDAEEREQLTYLYLSLVNDKKIDEDSRNIVLQALFSRSETGLLASETGPTMPGVNEIINSSLKQR